MFLCRDWAKELGIVLYLKDTRTKSHIIVLLGQYKAGKDLENATTSRNIVKQRKTKSND